MGWHLKLGYCLAIFFSFISGAILGGGGISFSYKPEWKAVFELGSYIATILVALVGVKTMNAWQAQFKHSEKYKVIKEFQSSLDGGRAAETYINGLFYKCLEASADNKMPGIMSFLGAMYDSQKAWNAKCFEVERRWANLKLLLSEDELSLFLQSPEDLEVSVREVANMLIEMATNDGSINFLQLNGVVIECCDSVRKQSLLMFDVSNGILKKLVG